MTPFTLIDEIVQSAGLTIESGQLYRQPQWVKWYAKEVTVSLYGSELHETCILSVLTGSGDGVWSLTTFPDADGMDEWRSRNLVELTEFELHLKSLIAVN